MLKEMREIFKLTFHFKFNELLFKKTNNSLLQFCRYVVVGGLSFIVDAFTLYTLTNMNIYYLVSNVFGFIVGVTLNYFLSKLMVFKDKNYSKRREYIIFMIISVIGLIFTTILMYLFTDLIGFNYMVSKMIAAIIVLIWNYGARKYVSKNRIV